MPTYAWLLTARYGPRRRRRPRAGRSPRSASPYSDAEHRGRARGRCSSRARRSSSGLATGGITATPDKEIVGADRLPAAPRHATAAAAMPAGPRTAPRRSAMNPAHAPPTGDRATSAVTHGCDDRAVPRVLRRAGPRGRSRRATASTWSRRRACPSTIEASGEQQADARTGCWATRPRTTASRSTTTRCPTGGSGCSSSRIVSGHRLRRRLSLHRQALVGEVAAAQMADARRRVAEAEPAATVAVSTAAVEAGEAIYKANCAACHGAELQGQASARTWWTAPGSTAASRRDRRTPSPTACPAKGMPTWGPILGPTKIGRGGRLRAIDRATAPISGENSGRSRRADVGFSGRAVGLSACRSTGASSGSTAGRVFLLQSSWWSRPGSRWAGTPARAGSTMPGAPAVSRSGPSSPRRTRILLVLLALFAAFALFFFTSLFGRHLVRLRLPADRVPRGVDPPNRDVGIEGDWRRPDDAATRAPGPRSRAGAGPAKWRSFARSSRWSSP